MADEKLLASEIPNPSFLWRRWRSFRQTDTTVLTEKDVPGKDLTGKWVIVSGANNGIGREATLSFAEWGANIILACRKPPPLEKHPREVVAECQEIAKKAGHDSTFEWWEIDNTDLYTIDTFAERWLATGRPLDILCNNAGTGSPSSDSAIRLTKDGFEFIHQVNFLAHVLLTFRLLPSLVASKEPRVICTTSCMSYHGIYDLENFNGKGAASTGQLYANNKLYFQIWLTEMQQLLLKNEKLKHVTMNGVHPGFVSTGIWNFSNGLADGPVIRYILNFLVSLYAIDAKQGSYCITHAATALECGPDPKVQGVGEIGGKGGGRYFNRIWDTENMPYVYNQDARTKLFDKVAEELKLPDKGLLDILR